MPPRTLAPPITDWFDLVKLQIDALREDCSILSDKSGIPSDATFELAKQAVERIRQLASFPTLPEAEVLAGVNREIVIIWDFPKGTVELSVSDKIVGRVYNGVNEALLDLPRVPPVLDHLSKAA